MSFSAFVKGATTAGLIGLAVLHPKPIADILNAATNAFRKAASI